MSSEKMREEFEAWAKERYNWHLHDDARDPEDRTLASWNGEIYGNRIVEGMWQAWQASRAAVMVQMPQQSGVNLDWNQAIRYCIQAVEAEGLGWKP